MCHQEQAGGAGRGPFRADTRSLKAGQGKVAMLFVEGQIGSGTEDTGHRLWHFKKSGLCTLLREDAWWHNGTCVSAGDACPEAHGKVGQALHTAGSRQRVGQGPGCPPTPGTTWVHGVGRPRPGPRLLLAEH